MDRLNGILLVTKSCGSDDCRNPYTILQKMSGGNFSSLDEAMSPSFDTYFSGLPRVGWQECMQYQFTANEIPYYPPGAMEGLGQEYRSATDNYVYHATNGTETPGNGGRMGTLVQRYATLKDVMKTARNVTEKEIGTIVNCSAPDYCGVVAV